MLMFSFCVARISTVNLKSTASKVGFGLVLITVMSITAFNANAQTKGLIYKRAVPISPATTSPLDPDGNGYSSVGTEGFTSGDITSTQTEIVYRSIPQLSVEPTADLGPGPDCSFTDMVDLSTDQRAVGMFVDADSNFMFRFRLGGSAPNSKGYSILIDTDNKFGFTGTNADPDATSGNPGFEIEIMLATNFGVRLYDVNGIGSAGTPVLKTVLPYANYAQKSIAYTTNCGDADYFYDFYMPLSVIQTYFPTFNGSKTIRLAGNTIIAPQSAVQGPISDLGGVDDNTYGNNPDAAWTALITASTPVASKDVATQTAPFSLKSVAPTVGAPLIAGASVSVNFTTTETSGKILIYKNGVKIDSVTFNAAGTVSKSLTLAANDVITAYTVATGKSVSDVSNSVTVGGTCSAAPVITGTAQNEKVMNGTGPANATIYFYSNGVKQSYTATVDGTGNWTMNFCNQYGGTQFCIPCGTIYATAQETGKCESGISNIFCSSNKSACGLSGSATYPQTATPVLTQTSILDTTTALSGTAAAGATVYLFVNNYQRANTSLGAGVTAWNISLSPTLNEGDVVTIIAQLTNNCMSVATAGVKVQRKLAAPVVTSPILTTATSISGTSSEAAGTTITVYKNGVAYATTTTVSASGTWTLSSGISGTLSANDQITAVASATGYAQSKVSNTVTVIAQTAVNYTPVISTASPYTEGGSSVSGTMTAPNGTLVAVYVDGYSIGTAAVSNNSWTLTGISTSPPDLYAGAKIIAYATSGGALGSPSNEVTVGCATIGGSNTVAVKITPICENGTTIVRVYAAEDGVVYTLRNSANTQDLSTSRLGLGDSLDIPSNALTSSQRIKVSAIKIGITTCSTLLTNSDSVTVYPLPTNSYSLSASTNPACEGTTNNIIVSTSEVGVKYQLRDSTTSANIGSAIKGTGGQLLLPTGTLSTTTTFEVVATDTTHPTQCSRSLNNTFKITVNPVTVANAGANQSLSCGTTTATLAGNTATVGTGIWTKVSGNGSITTPSDPTSGVTGLTSGLAVFKWSITNGSCTSESTVDIRLDCASTYTVRSSLLNIDTLRTGDVMASATDPDGNIVSAALSSGTIPAGLSLNSTTGAVTVTDSSQITPAVYNRDITTADALDGSNTQTVVITILNDQEAYYTNNTPKALALYANNDILSYATDGNGSITKAYLVSGSLPPGTSLNSSTGALYVSNASNLVNSSYSFDVITKDITGGSSRSTVSLFSLVPLPVELIKFEGKPEQDKVKLSWSTAMELNNDYFDVERSSEGVSFEKIGEVKGYGNSISINEYSFTDAYPLSGVSYYRLKQNDYNGDFEYSHIIAVKNIAKSLIPSEVDIFPNPSSGENITVVLKGLEAQDVTIEIYDMLGKKQFIKFYSFTSVKNINKIDVKPQHELSAGIYNMVISTGTETFTQKIVVKK